MENIEVIAQGGEALQGGLTVSVHRYLLLKGTDNKLVLRLYNGGNFVVTGIGFWVQGITSSGKPTKKQHLFYDGLSVLPQTEFAVPDVTLPPECVDARIGVERVYSEETVYTIEGQSVVAEYCGRNPRLLGRVYKKGTRRVSRKTERAVILLILACFLLSLGILAWTILPKAQPQKDDSKAPQQTAQRLYESENEDGTGVC